jgi:hypothetical protein
MNLNPNGIFHISLSLYTSVRRLWESSPTRFCSGSSSV